MHTFWPKNWDIHKIQSKISEASLNIVEHNNTKFTGITTDGIKIEFYVNNKTGEIFTAYIIL